MFDNYTLIKQTPPISTMIGITTLDWTSFNHQLDYNRGHKSFAAATALRQFRQRHNPLDPPTTTGKINRRAVIARSTLPGYLNPPGHQESLYLMSYFRLGKSLLSSHQHRPVDEDQFYVVFILLLSFIRSSPPRSLPFPSNFVCVCVFFLSCGESQEKSNLGPHRCRSHFIEPVAWGWRREMM